MFVSVTKLGSKLSMSRDAVNPALVEAGLLDKHYEGKKVKWVPTNEGKKWSKVVPGVDAKGKAYEMLVWDEAEICRRIGHLAPPSRAEYDDMVTKLELRLLAVEDRLA